MYKMILRITAMVIICLGVFWVVDSSFNDFAHDIQLKDPRDVFHLNLPEFQETETSELPTVRAENKKDSESSTNTGTKDNSIKDNNTKNNEIKDTTAKEKSNVKEVLKSGVTTSDIETLASSIRVSSGKNTTTYNRDTFERPSTTYTYNGQKLSRNKYAWHVSKHLISEDPFSYKCPYTGTIISDMRILDFDHIIPLAYVFKYGDVNWTNKERNRYAYDIYIGVDVLNKSNRSKSDKGPSEWLPDTNIASYCYSWLVICNKYDIAMRKADIDVCKLECLNDLEHCEMINKVNLDIEDITKF